MNKNIGYVLSVAGLFLIALSEQIAKQFPFAGGKTSIIIVAVIIILVGIIFIKKDTPSRRKIRQAEDEVPIYHGEGKHRRIVAYQKESKK